MLSPFRVAYLLAAFVALSSSVVNGAVLQPRTSNTPCTYTCPPQSNTRTNAMGYGDNNNGVLKCQYSDGTCKYSSQDGSPKGNNDNCCPSMATKQCGRRRRRRELSDDEETIMSRQAKIVRDENGARSVEASDYHSFF